MSLIKVFNSQFLDFINDVYTVLPNDLNVKTAKFYTEKIVKVNPALLIKSWYDIIIIPYKKYIDKGDFNFFLNKEYKKELAAGYDSDSVLNTIDVIKTCVRNFTDDDKQKIIKYTQNLTKISLMYKNKTII
jgi:hypothetical protein